MIDFLKFHTLISIDVLIVFYYVGAIILPLGILWFLFWIKARFVQNFVGAQTVIEVSTRKASNLLNPSSKTKWFVLFLVSFLFAELFWRLLFEFLIAFMQMRDALVLN